MIPALMTLPLACGATYEQGVTLRYGDGHQYGAAVYGA